MLVVKWLLETLVCVFVIVGIGFWLSSLGGKKV
ncbi:MAG: hypothetical protein PWQ18_1221 [Clostridia bacterium]|nr:hypothetical protein [Clostridia bacterium]